MNVFIPEFLRISNNEMNLNYSLIYYEISNNNIRYTYLHTWASYTKQHKEVKKKHLYEYIQI